MSFLAPAFLLGIAAVAVPVIIHLIHREKRVVVEFPSLMFLQRIPYKSVRRQKIRHLLLLILRCLAFALLAAAFARPFFEHPQAAVATRGAREVVILLDHSASMGYGARWARARDAAKKAANALTPGDHATLVLFANDAAVATPPNASATSLAAAIDGATLTSGRTRYGAALKLASQILAASKLPRREIVLVSDFQKSGWTTHDEVRVPRGTTVRPVDVAEGSAPDVAVSQVTTNRDSTGPRDHVIVAARLTNTGAAERKTDVRLVVGGRTVQTQPATIPAHGAAQVTFVSIAVPNGVTRGSVRLTPDSLPEDDVFDFTLAPDEAVPVLVVEPASPRDNQSLFLSRALAIGDRPSFRVDVTSSAALTPRDLDGRALVVLDEAPPPGGAVGARLRALVASGSGLLVIPGASDARGASEWRGIMPASAGAVVDRTGDAGATLSSLDYAHPIFEIFNAPRSGDFSTARFFRYRALSPAAGASVLARFDDGAPALVERSAGRGKVLAWASTMDSYWTNLPLQPVFLPFVHQLARHAGSYADPRAWFTAGEVLDLSRHEELTAPFTRGGADSASELVVQAPSGARTRATATGPGHLVTLAEQGFYELRGRATPVGGGRPIAVNLDPAESDLTHFAPQDLVAAITAPSAQPAAGSDLNTSTPQDQERRQRMWWYMLLVALLLLAAETTVSNRLSRATS
ncbi:MAG TPA: BatA domain-containing protein [Gemmatimonadaceae bacterium]|nr:BatA domain-containing protein [Gemmatimonadaceae bacterium]